jgi:hypothetical protein
MRILALPSLSISLFPDFPRCLAAVKEIVQLLLILERIHRREETVVLISDQLLFFHQTLKGLEHKLLAIAYVPKNIALQNEHSAIDTDAAAREFLDVGDEPIGPRLDDVIAEIRLHADKSRNLVVLAREIEIGRKRQIRQAVAIIRQKQLVIANIFFDRAQPLTDIRPHARVGKGDLPVVDVAARKLEVFATMGQDEVVR